MPDKYEIKKVNPGWFKIGHPPTSGAFKRGRLVSEEIREKIRKAKKGKFRELSYNWRDGLTSSKNIIKKCFKYRQWRKLCYNERICLRENIHEQRNIIKK